LGFSGWISTYVENRFTLPNVQLENAFSLAISQAFSFSCSFDKLSMDLSKSISKMRLISLIGLGVKYGKWWKTDD